MMDNTATTYSTMAIRLHWLIGILIILNLIGGLLADDLPRPVMMLHMSTGILILFLSLFRLFWRLTHRPPADVPLKAWEKGLAHLTHWAFYGLMILVPLSGWLMVSYYPKRAPISFYGLFDVPFLGNINEAASHTMGEGHEVMAFGMIGLLALHVLGAIKHQFDGNPVLHRIAPWMRAR